MGQAAERRKGYYERAVCSRVLQQGDRALVRSLAPPGGQGKLHPYWEEIDGGAVSGVKDVQGFSKLPPSTAQPRPAPFQYRYDLPFYLPIKGHYRCRRSSPPATNPLLTADDRRPAEIFLASESIIEECLKLIFF
eukprot:XP_011664388.1 PREDICTED: uncharacterized protein LOC105438366 [Strongylocentrotus purpuratus]